MTLVCVSRAVSFQASQYTMPGNIGTSTAHVDTADEFGGFEESASETPSHATGGGVKQIESHYGTGPDTEA